MYTINSADKCQLYTTVSQIQKSFLIIKLYVKYILFSLIQSCTILGVV